MNDFSTLELCSALRTNLIKNGFVKPTAVQAESIPPALDRRDVVATAQTGTGKTLAFALPILQRLATTQLPTGTKQTIRAVVLSPTRELAIQINDAFNKMTPGTQIRSAVVVGGMSEVVQLKAIRRGVQIVVATPGRLCDFLQRRLVDLSRVEVAVLDEADRMLDMGFLPSIRAILKQLPTSRQTMLFSATIETSVAHLIKDYVRDPVRVAIGTSTKPAELVDLFLYEVDQDQKLSLLQELLKNDQGAFLVFARTKHGAERLAKQLVRNGLKSTSIHGDRTQSQRNHALRGFKDGTYRILVATDVAARGIHVDDISHVVNFDLPQVPEDFIHRVGRTGRAGARGVASTFALRTERGDIRQIERALNIRMTKGGSVVPPRDQQPADQGKVVVIPFKDGAPAPRVVTRSFVPRGRRW